jgi:hypothetical protein
MSARDPKHEITWPLHDEEAARPLPADPRREVSAYAPDSAELKALYELTEFPDPTGEQARARARRLRQSKPTTTPDWMHAAQNLVNALQEMIQRGKVDPIEYAAVARAWAAWSLGGVTEAHILRVAHLVARAHAAIHETPELENSAEKAYRAAAGVLHTALPAVIRDRMPLERLVFLVRQLYAEKDRWAAVVEGTAEILGWKHYGRVHAASVIRVVMERGQVYVG